MYLANKIEIVSPNKIVRGRIKSLSKVDFSLALILLIIIANKQQQIIVIVWLFPFWMLSTKIELISDTVAARPSILTRFLLFVPIKL